MEGHLIFDYILFPRFNSITKSFIKKPLPISKSAIFSIVNPNLKIGDFVYIGSGAVVVKSIENNSKVVGNPAKNLKRN